jgi:hypothetical protein
MNRLATLSRADFLTPARTRLYGVCLAAVLLAVVGWIGVLSVLHAGATPIALDFAAFWAAARLAVAGHAATAYDNVAIEAVERAATAMPPGYLAFYYPPPFALLILPLGLLGYSAALAAFLAAEMALLLGLLRRILPQGWAWLPLLSYPGFLMNGLSGQDAPLSAACFAGAAIWLDRRPLLAGACLGGLVCKPQLAVLAPLALLAARRWRALAACAATAGSVAVLSWLALGAGVWRGFLANAPLARADIETIAIKWPRMQSLFGAVRLAGGGNAAAYAAQAVLSAAAAAALAWLCARRPGGRMEMAALATAALSFTPFLYDYDLAILAVPMACLMAAAQRTGWHDWEKLVLLAVFLLPLAANPAGMALHVIVGPPLVVALLAVLARRAA